MTEKQAQQLIDSINELAEAVNDITMATGQMGYTFADSLEAIALEPHYRELKEEKKKK